MDEAVGGSEEEIRRAGTDGGNVRLVPRECQNCKTGMNWGSGGAKCTLNTDELSSGSFTCEASKKLKAFHWTIASIKQTTNVHGITDAY